MVTINKTIQRAILTQQIALNNKMLESGHITKQTHFTAHNILLANLTNLTGQDMISHSDGI